MATTEQDIHAALMARVEVMAAALSHTVIWPRKGGKSPNAEHIRVNHLPNDSTAADLSSQVYERQGLLFMALVSPLGQYEAEAKAKAQAIAEYFPRGLSLTRNGTSLKLTRTYIRPGREEDQRWETPIIAEYWSMT